jgi:hypothetical protein
MADRPRSDAERPIGRWAFTAVAVSSLGSLSLAALIAPGVVGGASSSAGLTMLVGAILFTFQLAIWLGYSRHVHSSGGLFAFVEAAAGRRVALVQALVWVVSYLLYVFYTTVQIVYDVLPAAIPGERHYQTLLAILIPVSIAAVLNAGRAATLVVLGLMAAGQLVLAGILDGVSLAHISTPVSSFGASAPRGALIKAGTQTSLLYICGGLPLFLGGEVARPTRTIRRGLIGAFLATALVIILAVAPLAALPGLLGTAVPGESVIQQFGGRGLADVIGIGIAVSIAGVITCEYLALTRLVHAVTAWRIRPVTAAIGAAAVLVAPISLIDPQGFYDQLLKPSLVALWLSQLIVFAVYPLFARKHRQPAVPAWALAIVASGFAIYGLWTSLQQAVS